MAQPPNSNKPQTVDITSKSSMGLSDDLMKMMTPALDSIRSSLSDQTKIMSATFNLGVENARKAGLKANLAQSKAAEASDKITASVAPSAGDGGDGGSGGMSMPMLGLGSGIVAIAASLTGFDAAIKAMALPGKFKTFNTNWTKFTDEIVYMGIRIEEFAKKVKAFKPKLPRLPTISFLDADGKAFDFGKVWGETKLAGRLGDISRNVNGFFDRIKSAIDMKWTAAAELIDTKVTGIKTGVNGFFDGIKSSIDTRWTSLADTFDTKISGIKTGVNGFFDGIKTSVDGKLVQAADSPLAKSLGEIKSSVGKFFDGLPRMKITIPEGITGPGSISETITKVFGSLDGGGILGFLGKVGGFLKPLLTPFEFILKTVMRPFTQILLTIIDFVVGFYEGFTSEEGSMMDKVTAGIEGGLLGVVKGITEAIDLIFIKLPAWILEKLGFDGAAEGLREFSLTELIDPAWEAIKGFFKNLFNDPKGTLMGAASSFGDMAGELMKTILRAVLPDPSAGLMSFAGLAAAPLKMTGVYEYAGIDSKTGQVLPSAISSTASSSAADLLASDATATKNAGSSSGGTTVVNSAPTYVTKGGNQNNTNYAIQKPMSLATATAGFN